MKSTRKTIGTTAAVAISAYCRYSIQTARPKRGVADATSTMTTPPAMPDMKRHEKYQPNDSGTAQARKAAVIHTIISRSVRSLPRRAPTARPISAPQT